MSHVSISIFECHICFTYYQCHDFSFCLQRRQRNSSDSSRVDHSEPPYCKTKTKQSPRFQNFYLGICKHLLNYYLFCLRRLLTTLLTAVLNSPEFRKKKFSAAVHSQISSQKSIQLIFNFYRLVSLCIWWIP